MTLLLSQTTANNKSPKIITYNLSQTSTLLSPETNEHHRRWLEENESQRHLSRWERLYRMERGLSLDVEEEEESSGNNRRRLEAEVPPSPPLQVDEMPTPPLEEEGGEEDDEGEDGEEEEPPSLGSITFPTAPTIPSPSVTVPTIPITEPIVPADVTIPTISTMTTPTIAPVMAPTLPDVMAPTEPTISVVTEPTILPDPAMTEPTIPDPGMTEPTIPDPGMTEPTIPDPGMTEPTIPDPGMTLPTAIPPTVISTPTKPPVLAGTTVIDPPEVLPGAGTLPPDKITGMGPQDVVVVNEPTSMPVEATSTILDSPVADEPIVPESTTSPPVVTAAITTPPTPTGSVGSPATITATSPTTISITATTPTISTETNPLTASPVAPTIETTGDTTEETSEVTAPATTTATATATATTAGEDSDEDIDEEYDEDTIISTLTGGLLNTYQTSPLSQGYGTHYATVWVGSPNPQRKSVIVDTGSHYTAFPCVGCSNCGEDHHTDLYFDPAKSDTFKSLGCGECTGGAMCKDVPVGGQVEKRCQFSQSYTEGSSWRAYQVVDQFFCGGNTPKSATNPTDLSFAIDFMFGCQQSETGLFVTQLADGIMGMSAHEATLPKQMFEKGKLEHNMFALCFRRELNVSKQGVHAGVMTLGGIDSRLDSSPMVYAKNVGHGGGWYTVRVKNVYLRTTGGTSVVPEDLEKGLAATVKLPINVNAVNNGKGVIVDSGTTDTYFGRSMGSIFMAHWKEATGMDYSNKPMKLTKEELMTLPTLLIQLEAHDNDETIGDPNDIPGMVGSNLDPTSPNDVLIAIPASHFMEYSPSSDEYTSRLYFTESSGGVLGANAMQRHDVLFDWENGRVGFAESTCRYESGNAGVQEEMLGGEGGEDEGGVEIDCELSEEILSVGCMESIDLSPCVTDKTTRLAGKETWTMLVMNPGTPEGKSCEEVIQEHEHSISPDDEEIDIFCENGKCTESIPCHITCANAEAMGDFSDTKTPPEDIGDEDEQENEQEEGDIDNMADMDDEYVEEDKKPSCGGGNLWGACDYSCNQTRISSVLQNDGICHETGEEVRPCHIDACGRSDPCRVPFVVHAILVFRGANAPLWTRRMEDVFMEAFAETINANGSDMDHVGAGDVKVLMVSNWYGDQDGEGAEIDSETKGVDVERIPIGMKIVVEVSIFNFKAKIPISGHDTAVTTPSSNSTNNKINNVVIKVKNAYKGLLGPPLAECTEADLYPLSATALDIRMELSRAAFMQELIQTLQKSQQQQQAFSNPFEPVFQTNDFAQKSKLLSSWTIKTEIANVWTIPKNKDEFITHIPFFILVLSLLCCVCCCGMCCGSSCARRKRHQAQALVDQIKEQVDDRKRGKYSKIGEDVNGHHDSDDDDDDDEEVDLQFSTSAEYSDIPLNGNHDGDLELAKTNYDELRNRISQNGNKDEEDEDEEDDDDKSDGEKKD